LTFKVEECSSINGCVQGYESQCYGKVKFTALSNAAKKYMNAIARRYAQDPANHLNFF
jgi:hypothetical protein